ncbi:hypothetical protein ACF3MZ_07075 [Paenibacillaceae bacterium WGS1546]|uniref:hypothetical protein n=1 Tax=Cohnella sp. WGS1546 TaxID=3366810 RepID=UPI00372D0603
MLLLIPGCMYADPGNDEAGALPFAQTAFDSGKTDPIVVREAIAAGEHYRKVVYGDVVYVENVVDDTSDLLRRTSGKAMSAMERRNASAAPAFERWEESGLVDPVSLNTGIRPSIPYTYDAAPDQAFGYLETLIFDGWDIVASYRDAAFIDYYVRKNDAIARVIILESSLKVHYPIKGELPDARTFVSDR